MTIPFYARPCAPQRSPASRSAAAASSATTVRLTPIEQRAVRPSAGTAYKQIELLSRPAVKEAFEAFEDHNKTNRSEPYADPVLKRQIKSFSLMFRSENWADTLQAVLYPNVMKADLSQNTKKAAYLGYETGGATGSKFGGRAPRRRRDRHFARRDLRQYPLGARAYSRRP